MGLDLKIRYACNGCLAEAAAERHAFGRNWTAEVIEGIQSGAPDGWIIADPYTGCTYCPKCWAEILDHGAASEPLPEKGQG